MSHKSEQLVGGKDGDKKMGENTNKLCSHQMKRETGGDLKKLTWKIRPQTGAKLLHNPLRGFKVVPGVNPRSVTAKRQPRTGYNRDFSPRDNINMNRNMNTMNINYPNRMNKLCKRERRIGRGDPRRYNSPPGIVKNRGHTYFGRGEHEQVPPHGMYGRKTTDNTNTLTDREVTASPPNVANKSSLSVSPPSGTSSPRPITKRKLGGFNRFQHFTALDSRKAADKLKNIIAQKQEYISLCQQLPPGKVFHLARLNNIQSVRERHKNLDFLKYLKFCTEFEDQRRNNTNSLCAVYGQDMKNHYATYKPTSIHLNKKFNNNNNQLYRENNKYRQLQPLSSRSHSNKKIMNLTNSDKRIHLRKIGRGLLNEGKGEQRDIWKFRTNEEDMIDEQYIQEIIDQRGFGEGTAQFPKGELVDYGREDTKPEFSPQTSNLENNFSREHNFSFANKYNPPSNITNT